MLMLWSQIKLTSYDFSDVHITGEFDNRPGTGRFLGIFSCVVTYRNGAVRRLYLKHRPVLARAPYDVVRCPAGVVKDKPDTVRCPADFTRIFTCNDTFISKFAIIPQKKQVVKIRKIEADWCPGPLAPKADALPLHHQVN